MYATYRERTTVSNRLIVIAPEPKNFHVTLEQFRAASIHGQPYSRLAGPVDDSDPIDANIHVERPGEYFFQIFHFHDGDMISTDGSREQAAEVAVWAANTSRPRAWRQATPRA